MQYQVAESLLTTSKEIVTDAKPVPYPATPTSKQARHAFISTINKLVAFRAQGQLTEDEFREITAYVCSIYLEFSLESRLQKTFSKGLRRGFSFSDQ
ncbi:MAG: hypothetical protein HOP19_28470 [Acidobacteria bacterium]|nr:hypothetical protein [Acidobacteriota bacterium]